MLCHSCARVQRHHADSLEHKYQPHVNFRVLLSTQEASAPYPMDYYAKDGGPWSSSYMRPKATRA